MQYGVFITKENKNVLEKQSIFDYIVNSNYNTFKIYKVLNGILVVDTAPSTVTKIITHGLGYHPAFLSFYKLKQSSSAWWLDFTAVNSNVPNNDDYLSQGTYVNSTDIEFKASNGGAGGATNIEFKCFLLVDPINLVPSNITGIPLTTGYGFKISKPGVDVTKAKAHELLLSSKYDSLKFYMEKTVSFTVAGGGTSGSVSFEHGLGYIPIFVATAEDYTDTTKNKVVPLGRVPQTIATSVYANKSTITAVAVLAGDKPTPTTFRFRIIVCKNKLSDN